MTQLVTEPDPTVVIGDEMRVPRTWLETQSAFEGVIGLCQECQSPPSAVPPKMDSMITLISAAVVGVGAWFATNFLGKPVVAVREKRREARYFKVGLYSSAKLHTTAVRLLNDVADALRAYNRGSRGYDAA
jgi:hypothetical protein